VNRRTKAFFRLAIWRHDPDLYRVRDIGDFAAQRTGIIRECIQVERGGTQGLKFDLHAREAAASGGERPSRGTCTSEWHPSRSFECCWDEPTNHLDFGGDPLA